MANYRLQQMQARTKTVVSYLLQNEIKDPRLGFISVTDVQLTRDLAECKIYYSVLGNDEQNEATQEALKSASGYLRREVGKRANLRRSPELIFIKDDSLEYGSKINKLLDQVHNDEPH